MYHQSRNIGDMTLVKKPEPIPEKVETLEDNIENNEPQSPLDEWKLYYIYNITQK